MSVDETFVKIRPEEHLGLAHTVAARFVHRNERVQDTMEFSLACEALVLASQSYIPEQGAFSSVAYIAMVNKLIDYKRAESRKKRKAELEYLDDKQWSNQIDELQWEKQLEDIPDFMGWLSKVTWSDEEKDDLEVLIAVKVKAEPITEVADKRGVSRVTVYHKLQRITNKIREKYRDAA